LLHGQRLGGVGGEVVIQTDSATGTQQQAEQGYVERESSFFLWNFNSQNE
jgi:hypothetical protein